MVLFTRRECCGNKIDVDQIYCSAINMKISTPRWLFGINAILFCFVGILQFWIYWDGISEWWRITGLDFDEVKDTPYQKIWTSGRVIPALLFLIAGIVNLACFIRRSRTAGGESIE